MRDVEEISIARYAVNAGKGDTPRPVNGDRYRKNYEAIFGEPEWPDIIGGSCIYERPPYPLVGDRWYKPDNTVCAWDGKEWVDITSARGFAADCGYIFDGPETKPKPRREFMKTNTEGDE